MTKRTRIEIGHEPDSVWLVETVPSDRMPGIMFGEKDGQLYFELWQDNGMYVRKYVAKHLMKEFRDRLTSILKRCPDLRPPSSGNG